MTDFRYTTDTSSLPEMNDRRENLLVFCVEGSLGFALNNGNFSMRSSDFAYIPGGSLLRDFSATEGTSIEAISFRGSLFSLPAFSTPRGVVAMLALLSNPVVSLTSETAARIKEDMAALRRRLASDRGHLFRHELAEALATLLLADLCNAALNAAGRSDISERKSVLLYKFIAMLRRGDYRTERSLPRYASELDITPHYLTELCRDLTGEGAQYWLDRFTIAEVLDLLRSRRMSISEIVERMCFSSQSYFTRYVAKHLGVTPSFFR